jgi:hypothetical protein
MGPVVQAAIAINSTETATATYGDQVFIGESFFFPGSSPELDPIQNWARFSLAAGPGPQVPEPATWAFMIVGFGLVGAAMRRARKPMKAAAG